MIKKVSHLIRGFNTEEWKNYRLNILKACNGKCDRCQKNHEIWTTRDFALGNTHFYRGLNVHHEYYRKDLKPWEYPTDAVKPLCNDCHKSLHESGMKIPIYKDEQDMHLQINAEYVTPCSKCDGSGYLAEYDQVQNGICFQCHGAGYDEIINLNPETFKE